MDKTLMKCVKGTCNVEVAFEELDEIFHKVQPNKAFHVIHYKHF
jgi:hypothetical protein